MAQLPVRTTRNTRQNHVDDHNEIRRVHNILEAHAQALVDGGGGGGSFRFFYYDASMTPWDQSIDGHLANDLLWLYDPAQFQDTLWMLLPNSAFGGDDPTLSWESLPDNIGQQVITCVLELGPSSGGQAPFFSINTKAGQTGDLITINSADIGHIIFSIEADGTIWREVDGVQQNYATVQQALYGDVIATLTIAQVGDTGNFLDHGSAPVLPVLGTLSSSSQSMSAMLVQNAGQTIQFSVATPFANFSVTHAEIFVSTLDGSDQLKLVRTGSHALASGQFHFTDGSWTATQYGAANIGVYNINDSQIINGSAGGYLYRVSLDIAKTS